MILFFYGPLPGCPTWLHGALLVLSLVTQILPYFTSRRLEPIQFEESTTAAGDSLGPGATVAWIATVVSVVASIISFFVARQWRAHSRTLDENERCESVSAKLRDLPLHEYHTRETLATMSALELKTLLSMNTEEVCTEKSEVIDAILAAGGSSHCTCAVCYEDYQAGDVMRVLPCRHRYHVQCVDQWLLCQAKKGQGEVTSACPLCHAPV